MAKYISTYFDIFQQKLVFGLIQGQVHQKQKLPRERFELDYAWPSKSMGVNAVTPQKSFFRKCDSFEDLGFPLVI